MRSYPLFESSLRLGEDAVPARFSKEAERGEKPSAARGEAVRHAFSVASQAANVNVDDAWRVFSADFKRATVQRVVSGEKTVAEVSREARYCRQRHPQLDARRRGGRDDGRAGQ